MATAILFPGQGSLGPGARETVADACPELLERCVELVGEDPFARAGESTRFAQPATFCASLAGFRALGEPDAVALAGHSLGELTALTAAGALDPDDALALVVLRGRLMARAGEQTGDGTMLALLKATPEQAAALATGHGVAVANDNAPGQLVLSGERAALEAAATAARRDGLRPLALDVAGAFHSPAMASAAAPFALALREVTLRPPRVPVLSGLTAAPFADVRAELAGALTAPVRWRETMRALAAAGATRFVDVGPGRVLARLVARNLPDATAVTAEELGGVRA